MNATKKSYQLGSLHWVWLSLVVMVIDQVTKYIVRTTLPLDLPVKILPFFNLTFTHNQGSAFGFLNEYGMLATWLFAGIAH